MCRVQKRTHLDSDPGLAHLPDSLGWARKLRLRFLLSAVGVVPTWRAVWMIRSMSCVLSAWQVKGSQVKGALVIQRREMIVLSDGHGQ